MVGLLELVVVFFAEQQVAYGCRVVDRPSAYRLLMLGDGGFFLGNGNILGWLASPNSFGNGCGVPGPGPKSMAA